MTDLVFTVPGKAIPQGSKNVSRTGHTYEAAKNLTQWRDSVTWAARDAINTSNNPADFPIFGPVWLMLIFKFARPNGHYGTGRNTGVLKPTAPTYVTRTPDADKAARAICDSLTAAGVYRDDAQVAHLRAWKVYAETPSVEVQVRPLLDGEAAA